MYADTPSTLILSGTLGTAEITSLINYCGQLRTLGQRDLHLEMSAVLECDRGGLEGLLALLAGTALYVTIAGARWSQFTAMLATAPASDVDTLSNDVHVMLGDRPPPGRRA